MVLRAGSVRPWILLLGVSLYLLCVFAQSPLTFCDPVDCSTPAFPVLHHFLEFTQTHVIESVMPSTHLILCRLLFLLPSIFPSIGVFSNELSLCIRWPNIGASASIIPVNIQGWFHDWLVWSPCCPRDSQHHHFSNTTIQKHQFFSAQPSFMVQLTSVYNYWKSYNFD